MGISLPREQQDRLIPEAAHLRLRPLETASVGSLMPYRLMIGKSHSPERLFKEELTPAECGFELVKGHCIGVETGEKYPIDPFRVAALNHLQHEHIPAVDRSDAINQHLPGSGRHDWPASRAPETGNLCNRF